MQLKTITEAFSPKGCIATSLPDFEARPQQIEMVEAVANAFDKEETVVIEAPTGIGKSLAYLLPAIQWTTLTDERVVISTNTINLQEQLIRKDVPLLERALKTSLKISLLKGRANYICMRQTKYLLEQGLLFGSRINEIDIIKKWINETKDGSKSELPITPSAQLWGEICSDKDRCQGNKCPDYDECFYQKSRAKAAQANILIVNHHLLLSDLFIRINTASEITVIPPYSSLIIDEAHHLEAVGQRHLGGSLILSTIGKTVSKLTGKQFKRKNAVYSKNRFSSTNINNERATPYMGKGLLTTMNSMVSQPSLFGETCNNLLGRELKKAQDQSKFIEEETRNIESILEASIGRGIIGHKIIDQNFATTSKWLKVIEPALSRLNQNLKDLAVTVAYIGKLIKDRSDYSPDSALGHMTADFDKISTSLSKFATTVSWFMDGKDTSCCRWYESSEKWIKLNLCPFDVSKTLSEHLFSPLDSVVITSATLCINNSFDYITKTLGLTDSKCRCIKLESPFNFKENMFVGIPVNIAQPGSSYHVSQITKIIRKSISITAGRAFILFTSYKMMYQVYDALEEDLLDLSYTPMIQGRMSREHLIEAFCEEPSPVLFGTSSFWEGVDVKGDALVLVVIVKLPFQVPTDPFVSAKGEWLKKRGLHPFMDDSLPKAVIALKQGVGRLIRSNTDAGAILILDKRVVTKGYGRQFLSSLPQSNPAKGNWRQIEAAMEQFADQKL